MQRGGENCKSLPTTDLAKIDQYSTFELTFEFPINGIYEVRKFQEYLDQFKATSYTDWLYYERSLYDGKLIAPFCTQQDLDRVVNIIKSLNNNDTTQQKITKNKTETICRVCKETNPYANSDCLTTPNEYTCWSCGTHPSRYKIGLTTNEQMEKIKSIYRGQGFWSR